MNYYIILSPGITGMGGSQMYTRNKYLDAEKRGYKCLVFHSSSKGDVYIEELKQHLPNKVSELAFSPLFFSTKKRELVLQFMESKIINSDIIIIESHHLSSGLWGELLAKRLNAKHFVYLLSEHNHIRSSSIYNFYKFKYDHHSLCGIKPNTLKELFAGRLDLSEADSRYLRASCNNVLEDIPYKKLKEIPSADFTISTIGRLNKPFVKPMIRDIIRFANAHPDKTFCVLLIGGVLPGFNNVIEIENQLNKYPNISYHTTGFIYPIPLELVRKSDVCIASAGSCSVAVRSGIPCVSIDSNDFKAIGIYTVTTKHSLFRDASEPPIDTAIMLKKVLIDGKFGKKDINITSNIDFSAHWAFIEKVPNIVYYDVQNMVLSRFEKVQKLILKTMGISCLNYFMREALKIRIKIHS